MVRGVRNLSKLPDVKTLNGLKRLFTLADDPRYSLIQVDYDKYADLFRQAYDKAYRIRNTSGLRTVDLILNSYRNTGFYSDIIYGVQGVGKSSYAFQLAYYVYRDWRLVFLHLIIDPLQLMDFLKFLRKNDLRAPVIIVDDAGILFGRTVYLADRRRYIAIKGIVDLARSGSASILYTTPSPLGLSNQLRTMNTYLSKISFYNNEIRQVIKYRRTILPSGTMYIKKAFIERFNVYLPPLVYKYYWRLRQSYIELMEKIILAIPSNFNTGKLHGEQ